MLCILSGGRDMKRIIAFGSTIIFASLVPATMALAAANPSGQGIPNQDCQAIETAGGITPGNAGTSPGSPFNEPGFGSVNGGTGGQAYNNAGAPSQYDVACYQVNQ